jgi:hypothetical protein
MTIDINFALLAIPLPTVLPSPISLTSQICFLEHSHSLFASGSLASGLAASKSALFAITLVLGPKYHVLSPAHLATLRLIVAEEQYVIL